MAGANEYAAKLAISPAATVSSKKERKNKRELSVQCSYFPILLHKTHGVP
jgi:hypothetical protein